MVLIARQRHQDRPRTLIVSVPLRGLWFLSTPTLARWCSTTELVSVPLRGLWFLSPTVNEVDQNKVEESFRPLAGIMVLILRKDSVIMKSIQNVSVPLRGLWFLSRKSSLSSCESLLSSCFRPLAGIMVLIFKNDTVEVREKKTGSFRPLAGIMVLIGTIEPWQPNTNREFPSPCGDYGSYQSLIPCGSSVAIPSFRPLAGIMVLILFPLRN